MGWNKWYRFRSYIKHSLWIVPLVALLMQMVVTRVTHAIGGWLLNSYHKPFVFQAGVMAEVDEQPHLDAGGAQVVHELGPMLIGQGGDRLDFDDDLAQTEEVRPVGLAQRPALIAQANFLLGQELNALAG